MKHLKSYHFAVEVIFKNDSVKMSGQKQDLIITTAEHYAILLGNK